MIGSLTKYGAVSGKVRALYGKRLTEADYQTLSKMKTVPEIAAFLKNHPGWARSLEGIGLTNIGRGALESALRRQYLDEYNRIFKFISRDDREIMLMPVHRAELELIMSVLRSLSSNNSLSISPLPDYYIKLSKLDIGAITASRSAQELLTAVRGSIYEPALRHAISAGTANLSSIELILNNVYYSHLLKYIDKNYKGETRAVLRESLEMESDVLSLIMYLRTKRYFPDVSPAVLTFYFPTAGRLGREFIAQLSHAPDYETAFRLVKTSVYRDVFKGETTAGIESFYYRMVFSYNKKRLRAPEPSIYTPIAYLALLDIELINIINIIESVRYGLDFESSVIQLITKL